MLLFFHLFAQQKVDFRTPEEQAKIQRLLLKNLITFPGMGQIYNDQKIKGYSLMAAEIFPYGALMKTEKNIKTIRK